ncbi:UPF0481 protein At3g47200-like [Carex rostrata]
MQRELDKLWGSTNEATNFTIFRTPHNISQSKKNLFEPSVISIGPFHHGQEHLRTLEEQKWRFLRDFLSRKDHISLNLCITEMKSLEESTRRCYCEKFDDLKSKEFVEMMLLDGCFLLEYFLKRIEKKWDSILEVGWNSLFKYGDFLLLENQIPFFIVEKLMELIGFNQERKMFFVKYLVYNLLPHSTFRDPRAEAPGTRDSINANPPAELQERLARIPDPPAEIHHLVHLCYHYLVPNPGIPVVLSSKPLCLTKIFRANRIINGLLHRFHSRVLRGRSPHSISQNSSVPLPNSTGNISSMVILCATELKQKGVKFTPKSNPKHMLDISFEYGVLKIPSLKITDATKPFFTNLLAFEQSKYGKENSPFTSVVIFFDNLVNTPNDVTILQDCGIVENCLGSEEALTHFINQVTEGGILLEGHYLAELKREVNRYIGSSWNRQRANLIRNYFSSPWATISLIAAFILLVLTLVQSFFAVYAYFIPPSS